MQWRKHEAARLRMAQTSVFADHIATKIAYVKPASEDALLELGARLTASGVQQARWHTMQDCARMSCQDCTDALTDVDGGCCVFRFFCHNHALRFVPGFIFSHHSVCRSMFEIVEGSVW
eukprot:6174635-Pleurochrysis_carterae.AAC.1